MSINNPKINDKLLTDYIDAIMSDPVVVYEPEATEASKERVALFDEVEGIVMDLTPQEMVDLIKQIARLTNEKIKDAVLRKQTAKNLILNTLGLRCSQEFFDNHPNMHLYDERQIVKYTPEQKQKIENLLLNIDNSAENIESSIFSNFVESLRGYHYNLEVEYPGHVSPKIQINDHVIEEYVKIAAKLRLTDEIISRYNINTKYEYPEDELFKYQFHELINNLSPQEMIELIKKIIGTVENLFKNLENKHKRLTLGILEDVIRSRKSIDVFRKYLYTLPSDPRCVVRYAPEQEEQLKKILLGLKRGEPKLFEYELSYLIFYATGKWLNLDKRYADK